MAKKAKEKSMEAVLWDSCNKLRGNVEPPEYKHVMLSLIFLKYANDKFDEHRKALIDDGKEKFLEIVSFYTKDNVFFIPEKSRWSYLMTEAKAEPEKIATTIDTALHDIELKNSALSGALPDNYYSRLGLDSTSLCTLLDKMDAINLQKEPDKDIFGRVYEYFLSHFALQEGKGKGEYFTPKTVVQLLCELIEPYSGVVYDGASGSGGMFVQSAKFIEEHKGNKKAISVYGQEYTATTLKLSKMNLAIRGISAKFGQSKSTLTADQFPDLKVDYALMNPPFNQSGWRNEGEHEKDPRWKIGDFAPIVPPTSNANYAWILNMVSKLKSGSGKGCLILANGALSATGDEAKIRENLIKADLVEAIIILPMNMFYTTDISVTVWVFNKNKKAHEENGRKLIDRTNKILFMDLRQKGHPYEKKYLEFNDDDRREFANTYHNWQMGKDYENIKEYCYSASINEIEKNDYSLVASKYIEMDKVESEFNYDSEMKAIQNDLSDLLKQEKKSQDELLAALEELGYGIK